MSINTKKNIPSLSLSLSLTHTHTHTHAHTRTHTTNSDLPPSSQQISFQTLHLKAFYLNVLTNFYFGIILDLQKSYQEVQRVLVYPSSISPPITLVHLPKPGDDTAQQPWGPIWPAACFCRSCKQSRVLYF